MLKLKDNMSTAQQPICVENEISISAKEVAEMLRKFAKEKNIEVEISDDTIHDGGFSPVKTILV